MAQLYVINSEQKKKPFSFWKVYRSVRRAGSSPEVAQRIASQIKREAFAGMTTDQIFKRVRQLLLKEEPRSALKFSLKEGMRKLGPTGFAFEKYIGEIFLRMGYKVKLNQQVPGYCCRFYEIDFIAQKGNLVYVGECKFHHLPGRKVHSDVALSNYARFLDIKKSGYLNSTRGRILKSILVTNTKFTTKAIDYSRCVGVELLGWSYPRNKGLEYLIETYQLYPITILPSWKKSWSEIFVQRKMMLAQDILKIDPKKFSKKTKIPQNKIEKLRKEAEILLG